MAGRLLKTPMHLPVICLPLCLCVRPDASVLLHVFVWMRVFAVECLEMIRWVIDAWSLYCICQRQIQLVRHQMTTMMEDEEEEEEEEVLIKLWREPAVWCSEIPETLLLNGD